jgi:nucleoside-diphosphate-sugar epimerase
MAHGRLAALAGATGFLGRRLVAKLSDGGWRVRALVRRPADHAGLLSAGVEVVQGDLSDEAALRRLVDGADVAINCAGLVKARSLDAYLAANRDGAANFAKAAGGRVILVSSLAAREPHLSDYAASKRAGEDASRAAAADRLAIIRPPAIYGPGDRETLGLFRLAGWSPVAPLPGDAAARLALAHVDDVVDAIVDLIDRPELVETYAIGGDRPEGYAWTEIADAAWRAMGRQARGARVPAWGLKAAASASEAIAAVRGTASVFNRGKATEILFGDWSVAVSDLVPGGPPARFALDAGFANTVAWYREQGWL